MNKTALKVGYWAAAVSIAAFAGYTVCFIAILFVNPIFLWSNFENYIKAVQDSNQFFKHIAMLFMIIYGACFVIQLVAIEEYAEVPKKFYVRIAELFGTGFFILIGINYFIQISSVRMQIDIGKTNGLEQFVQAYPISIMASVNMLGWTVFYGLSCLFASFAFGNTDNEKIIKYTLFANGIAMLFGAVSYLFNKEVLVFIIMNIWLGAAVLIASFTLCNLFKNPQLQK